METFSALLVLCAGNSPVTGEFPAQRPATRSFGVFFDLRRTWRGTWSLTGYIGCPFVHKWSQHWNGNVILTKLSSLAAPEVVKSTPLNRNQVIKGHIVQPKLMATIEGRQLAQRSTMASQITDNSVVYATACPGRQQRKYQISIYITGPLWGVDLYTSGFPRKRQ